MTSTIRNSGADAKQAQAFKYGEVLKWLLRNNFTDKHLVFDLLQLRRSGGYSTIQNMISAGLVGETRVTGCPVPLIFLRPAGLAAAQRLLAVHASRLYVAQVQHDLVAQRVVLDWQRKNPGSLIRSEKQLRSRGFTVGAGIDDSFGKIPDALIHICPTANIQQKQTWAVEVQENEEAKEVAERKLCQYFVAIDRQEIHGLVYVSTRPSVLETIKKIAHTDVRRWSYSRVAKNWEPLLNHSSPTKDWILNERLVFVPRPDLAKPYYQYTVR